MSHFAVIVAGENIEEQLAPYQENNMGDCPREYMEFNNIEEEKLEQYATADVERVVLSNGELVSPYDKRFRVKSKDSPFGTTIIPENLKRKSVPLVEIYPTFEEYMAFTGYTERDNLTGKYGYWHNPNCKWDWYVIGGRWTGYFRLKTSKTGKLGQPGAFDNKPEPGNVDQALKGDIDFEGMINISEEKAGIYYDKVITILGKKMVLQYTWDQLLANAYPDISKRIPPDEKREIFWNQEDCKLWKSKEEELRKLVGFFTGPEEFAVEKTVYVKRAGECAISSFAFVKNGEWYERGEMGWWGVVRDEKSLDTWNTTFVDLLKSVPDNELLTAVDCHI